MTLSFQSNPCRLALLGAASAASLLGAAHATVVVNNFTNNAPAGGAVQAVHDPSLFGTPDLLSASGADLIQGLPALVAYTGGSGSTTTESSGGQSVWTNGQITTVYANPGSAGDAIDHAAYGTVNATVGGVNIDTFVTYDLGGFFDLNRIDVFLGWNDSGRDDASFNVLVSTDNVTFSSIASYLKPADNTGAITTPVTNLHRVVDDGAGAIASGVRYVQFQFTDADNGYAGLLEIDVFGAAVPEPSVAWLGALGAAVSLRRRRR